MDYTIVPMSSRQPSALNPSRRKPLVARESRSPLKLATPAAPNRVGPETTGSGVRLDVDGLSPAAVRAFVNIAQAWGLDEKMQLTLLGQPSRSTFYQWKRTPGNARLPADTLERVSYLLGVYKALHILLPDAQAADGWVKRPNAASPFNGRSALELMLAGQVVDLYRVRSYLDAQRGW